MTGYVGSLVSPVVVCSREDQAEGGESLLGFTVVIRG